MRMLLNKKMLRMQQDLPKYGIDYILLTNLANLSANREF